MPRVHFADYGDHLEAYDGSGPDARQVGEAYKLPPRPGDRHPGWDVCAGSRQRTAKNKPAARALLRLWGQQTIEAASEPPERAA